MTQPTMMQNAQGHYVPVDKIPDIDLQRDALVLGIARKAALLREQMQQFKQDVMDDIRAHMEISAEQYGIKLGGKKGNLQLTSFNGEYQVILAIAESLHFDERLQIAKQMIDNCIHKWTQDSNSNARALIEHAFQTDKQGNINFSRVWALQKLKIDDSEWNQAMQALKDSINVASSKEYLRVYRKREKDGKYEPIALDLAAL